MNFIFDRVATIFIDPWPSSTAPIQSGSVIGYPPLLPYRNLPNQSHASFGLSSMNYKLLAFAPYFLSVVKVIFS